MLKFSFSQVLIGYTSLERAHANLGVTDAEFDEVVLILGETLNAAGFEIEDLKQVCGAVEARRRLIVQGERAPCM